MSLEGTRLRGSWTTALKNAQTRLRDLLTSSSSQWRLVPLPSSRENTTLSATSPSNDSRSSPSKGKSRSKTTATSQVSDVIVHRKASKEGDIYRAVLDVSINAADVFDAGSGKPKDCTSAALLNLETWAAVLATPELRKEYDPIVQDGRIIEMFDPETRIARIDFGLGWPANPRDAITIAKAYVDSSTLIDISTSLPRSADEPAYLRPAPPFVRSHIHLYAWCVQLLPTSSETPRSNVPTNVRVTCFWQHDLKSIWGIGNSIHQHLRSMLAGIIRTVQSHGSRMPYMRGYGRGVGMTHIDFQGPRQLLTLEYIIAGDDDDDDTHISLTSSGFDDSLNALKEYRRLERGIECTLPRALSWDVRVNTRSSTILSAPQFVPQASRPTTPSISYLDDPITLRISHPKPREHTVLKVTVSIEPSASLSAGVNTRALRVNGTSQPIHRVEPRDPSSTALVFSSSSPVSRQMIGEAMAIAGMALQNGSSSSSIAASAQSSVSDRTQQTFPGGLKGSRGGGRPDIPGVRSARSAAAAKAVVSNVRRNYIYFTSLLQEPEAKWSKPITEARGVTVTQLNSIDPTLVVYRAEAVFVGVGVWDLLSIVSTPGVRTYWNKGHDDAVYLEHVSELTELWHIKNRATWPVNARDSVQVKTTYKSPTACHVFSFSTDDSKLFPAIPPVEPGTIRTQVDLQGWAIEALSPNTTLLTLLDQSDPKGWSNKSSIPSQMIAAVAGMGEFAIRHGGPPMATRMMGSRVVNSRYDYERHTFRLDYETTPASSTPTMPGPSSDAQESQTTTDITSHELTPLASNSDLPVVEDSGSVTSQVSSPVDPIIPTTVECEIRCDIDTWANSLDVIVDPAPQTFTCLRRHKLAGSGGGLWLTVEHDATRVSDEHIVIVIRKGGTGSKDRGVVTVNGVKARVDVEDLPEHEIQSLARKKRVKPARVPLDQPPVFSVTRRRGTMDDENQVRLPQSDTVTARYLDSPFLRLFTLRANQTPTSPSDEPTTSIPPATPSPDARPPMHIAFDALSRVRELHSQSISDGWSLVSEKDVAVYRKIDARLSSKTAIHKAQRVIEGFGAEEIAAVISNPPSRTQWDDRIESVVLLDSYGASCTTQFMVAKAGFPFRDRGFFTASLVARVSPDDTQEHANSGDARQRALSVTSGSVRGVPPLPKPHTPALTCVAASFATVTPRRYSQSKVNPLDLPIGQILVEGWVLETLDPYTSENLAIPSTRCTLISAIDLAGSVPLSYNQSHNLANIRVVLALERYLKGTSPPPYPLLPAPALTIDEVVDDISRADGQLFSWQVSQIDITRKLLSASFVPDDKTYRLAVLLTPLVSSSPVEESHSGAATPDGLPSPSSRPNNTRDEDGLPAQTSHFRSPSRSSTLSQTNAPPRPRTASTSYTSKFDGAAHGRQLEDTPPDLVVCEMVIDEAMFKSGCDLEVCSRLLTPPTGDNGSPALPLHSIPTTESDIAVNFALHSVSTSTLASTSFSSPTKRCILRITIPTATYSTPPVRDPLIGDVPTPPSKPDWLTAFEERGAIVGVQIKPRDERKFIVMVGNTKVPFTSTSVQSACVSERVAEWPRLRRISFDPDAFPAMEEPIASATHLFQELHEPGIKNEDERPSPAVATSTDTDSSSMGSPPGAETPVTEGPAVGLLGFLGQYRRSSGPGTQSKFNHARYWPVSSTLSVPGRWLSRQSSLSNIEVTPGSEAKPSSSRRLTEQSATPWQIPTTFRLRAVIFVALIAFLLGSLLRSILSPGDFVLINGHIGRGVPQWQEIKRLMHLHIFSFGLVIAIVRRAPP